LGGAARCSSWGGSNRLGLLIGLVKLLKAIVFAASHKFEYPNRLLELALEGFVVQLLGIREVERVADQRLLLA
jgi:hypothetical protein